MSTLTDPTTAEELALWLKDARDRTFELVSDLNDEQLMGPQLSIVNPLLWEMGHVAWFHEKWILRHVCGREAARGKVDELYDSIAIGHERRWDLPLFSREEVFGFLRGVRDRVLEQLETRPLDDQLIYFIKLGVFHEDMHTEAFTYTRQTLAYPPPRIGIAPQDQSTRTEPAQAQAGSNGGDVEHPGGSFMLGASETEPFVFDNEKWAHPVEVNAFAMAATAVTQIEFAAFVEDDGYRREDLWSQDGLKWRQDTGAEHPVYWQAQAKGNWLRRDFDRWVSLEPNRPMLHVNWFEADAYCRWAGRRLPTEAEWELAASNTPGGGPSDHKRRFPWGDDPPTPAKASLDWQAMGTVDVDTLRDGDSAFGCRQMMGNVWEWTASDFVPYPGFVADPYKEYSEPWFGTRNVLRGGCWATRSRMLRNTWRNFYPPDRRDVWAGFRTCAV